MNGKLTSRIRFDKLNSLTAIYSDPRFKQIISGEIIGKDTEDAVKVILDKKTV